MSRARILWLVLWLLGSSAWSRSSAQLDLPTKPRPAPNPAPKDPAVELLPSRGPGGDLAPRPGEAPLDLPGGAAPAPAPAVAAPLTTPGAPEEAARAVFRELSTRREASAAVPALERLLALGPAALAVARGELGGSHAPRLLAAARLCLVAGQSADRAAVAARLTLAMPPEGAVLLEELLARDPVLTPPEYLVGLLDHPGLPLRTAALKALEPRLESVPLPTLAAQLASKRTTTRAAVLELIARKPDPLAWNLIASLLADPSAQIARRAADLLAAIDEAEPLLLERAFPSSEPTGPLSWDRARGYALLAVVAREELRATRLLEGDSFEQRVESLRGGLTSAQPLVAGACAVGLARLGFRASASRVGSWLEREVPHQLVRCGTGAEFHGDFSSLERPAQQALSLISGQSFGADGDAWRRWWLASEGTFRARHAVIELAPGASERLEVGFRDALGRQWRLLGPLRPTGSAAGTALRLDAAAAERLLARLEQEGVFGVTRPPEARTGADCDLVVAVGGEEKRFRASGSTGEPWLAALVAELAGLVEENRWQLYADPKLQGGSEGWRAEQARWAALEPLARQRAMVDLLLLRARVADPAGRDGCIGEVVRLYGDAAVPVAAHFEPLLGLLSQEAVFGPRAESLCELARVAAGAPGGEQAEPEARERLVSFVLEHFGPESDAALARVARNLEEPALRVLAGHGLPRARALAAAGVLRLPDGAELARPLLADTELGVRLAVLAALEADPPSAELGETLRPELVARARSESVPERAAALVVLARLGGQDVHDLALEALGDTDERMQSAGVEALAQLADPRTASLLASILARGASSPLFAAARRGLARLGPAGVEECLRLARSSSPRARREATLLLSERLAPEAAALLLTLLTEDPGDERVRWELSVLSGLDLAAEEHPERAAWSWWDLVVHDDPLAWLLAAAERVGIQAPPRTSFAGGLTSEGARFLLAVAAQPEAQLAERAARELELGLGQEFSRPASSAGRAQFLQELRDAVRTRFGE
jgi:HEAT repeat protein